MEFIQSITLCPIVIYLANTFSVLNIQLKTFFFKSYILCFLQALICRTTSPQIGFQVSIRINTGSDFTCVFIKCQCDQYSSSRKHLPIFDRFIFIITSNIKPHLTSAALIEKARWMHLMAGNITNIVLIILLILYSYVRLFVYARQMADVQVLLKLTSKTQSSRLSEHQWIHSVMSIFL